MVVEPAAELVVGVPAGVVGVVTGAFGVEEVVPGATGVEPVVLLLVVVPVVDPVPVDEVPPVKQEVSELG